MTDPMAIIKATFTKSSGGAKASIRYIVHRPGKDHAKVSRTLFGSDGVMTRQEAYQLIDGAASGSLFYRVVVSPDPKREDTDKDLWLREVAERTMQHLEERVKTTVAWVGAIHADHTDIRHVHLVAVAPHRLQVADLQSLRQAATQVSLEQRRQLDLLKTAREAAAQAGREEGAAWERGL